MKKFLPYAFILALGATIYTFLTSKYNSDHDQIKASFKAEKTADMAAVAKDLEYAFRAFYQGLRTIALLPGVRDIDRYAKDFHEDSRQAMQQIYNNTYLNVTLSEVYLLPASLDPEKTDPVTGKPEEPILTFDQFIVGKGTEEVHADSPKTEALEEVEIYEYRLMKTQLEHLKSKYPNMSKIKGIDLPAISGEPVVTCDNSEFTAADLAAGKDGNRLGIIYTVPRYSSDGKFAGGVSGIVRTNIIEKIAPEGRYAIANKRDSYIGMKNPIPELKNSIAIFKDGQKNPELYFSGKQKLNIVDDANTWELWAVAPQVEFESLEQLHQALLIYRSGLAGTVALMAMLSLGAFFAQRNKTFLEAKVTEKTLEISERNRSMRMILDNAEEGFLTCNLDGTMGDEYSKIIETWFGIPTSKIQVWDFIFNDNPRKKLFFKASWDQLAEEIFDFELSADQMPAQLEQNDHFYGLTYTPVRNQEGKLTKILLVVADETKMMIAQNKESKQKELLSAFQFISRDKSGFLEFYADAEGLVTALQDKKIPTTKDKQFRLIHTLKGNTAQYGLSGISDVCHVYESKLQEQTEPLGESDISKIANSWSETSDRIISLIKTSDKKILEIDEAEYLEALKVIHSGASNMDVAKLVESWRLEPIAIRLNRYRDQINTLAEKLGHPQNLMIHINDNGVRMEPGSYREFWNNIIHVIRNTVDHGFRDSKVAKPEVSLTTELTDHTFTIAVSDNGNGIDWETIRNKAKSAGLPHTSHKDLENCIFHDGFSTRSEVSATSGRGVGMAAVKNAVLEYDGEIKIISEKGKGSTFEFSFPIQKLAKVAA